MHAASVLLGAVGFLVLTQAPSKPEPSNRLNPKHPHVELLFESRVPRLKLFANRELTGKPLVELDERGLFSNDRLVCSWPGGAYDAANGRSMVLGYRDADAQDYVGCGDATPVRSFWYYEYGRWAQLVVEVIAHHGSLAESRCDTRPCYFSLEALPGRPRARPSWYVGNNDGTATGWDWWISGREQQRIDAARRRALRRDRALQTFLREARTCLTSSAAPGCFARFVQDPINYPEAGIGNGMITPEQFVASVVAVSQPSHADSEPWPHLVQCFERANGDTTDMTADHGWECRLESVNGSWKLSVLLQNPD